MAAKSEDERHEELIAAVLTVALLQTVQKPATPYNPSYVVRRHRDILQELQKPRP